jgi:anti-sigma B factor antagonist
MSNVPFSFTSQPGQRSDTQIVRLNGPLTLSSMFSFQTALREMKPQVLIMDLTESPYMDSAGLGLLMNQHVSADQHKRKFLLAGVNGRIQSLIEMTKVDQVLSIFPTVADAEASL